MTYVLMGPPASGKSTQAARLGDALHIPVIGIGDILRDKAQHDPELAQTLTNGDLLDPETIHALLVDVHAKHPDGVILDGAFRQPEQVGMVLSLWPKVTVLLFEAHDQVLTERITKRTSADLENRTDISEATVKHRIALYYKTLPSIMEAIDSRHLPVHFFDANQPLELITKQITETL